MRSRGSWAVGLVLVGVLASAGCTAEGTAAPTTPRPTTSSHATAAPIPDPSPTPSSAPSVAPTSGPDQDVTKPPARPSALDGPATEDNAVAVGRYFLALFPYINATGDLTAWDELSGAECKFCASSHERVVTRFDAGNRGIGGAIDFGWGTATAEGRDRFLVELQLHQYGSQTVDAGGAVVEDFSDPMDLRANMRVSRGADGWSVDGVQVDEVGSGR